jgi:hypothetical protein
MVTVLSCCYIFFSFFFQEDQSSTEKRAAQCRETYVRNECVVAVHCPENSYDIPEVLIQQFIQAVISTYIWMSCTVLLLQLYCMYNCTCMYTHLHACTHTCMHRWASLTRNLTS